LIEKAVLDETNAIAANDVSNAVACISTKNLPPKLLELVSTTQAFDDDDSDWIRHLGMIEIARSCGDRKSFEALLNFGLTRRGNVLISTLNAIVDCALTRIREGDKDVVEKVLLKTRTDSKKHHREASIAAFCALSIEGKVPDEMLLHLWEFAVDADLDQYSRCSSLEAIGRSNFKLTPIQFDKLVSLAQTDDSDIGWRALEILVRRDQGLKHEWQSKKLGIEKHDKGLIINDPEKVTWWQAFLISLQFREHPKELAACVAAIVEKAPNAAMYQALNSLVELGGQCSEIVARALVRRIGESNGYGRTDTELFRVLQIVSEKKLLTLAKAYDVKEWLPIARTALCESIGRIAIDSRSNSEEALVWLRGFTGDASFQVRRSAYRALSKADPDRLGVFCSALCHSSSIEARKRAAECAAWLPRDRYTDRAVEELGLAWDRESKVREVWKGMIQQRRNRQLSQIYLDKLLSGCVGENGVLKTYRYARALERLGDDETIDLIENFLEKNILRSHVGHYLEKLHKAIKKNWKKVTDKWPDPWTHESGFIEEVEAKIIPGMHPLEVSLKLSCRYRRSPSNRSDWSAVAIAREGEVSLGFGLPSEAIEIQIPEREIAKAHVFGLDWTINDTHAIFTLRAASDYPVGKQSEEPEFNDLQASIKQIFDDSNLQIPKNVSSAIHNAIETAKVRAIECHFVDEEELKMKEVCQYTASLLTAIAPHLPETFNANVALWRIADRSIEPYSRTLRLTAVEIDDLQNLAQVDSQDSSDELVFWLLERLEIQIETQPRNVLK